MTVAARRSYLHGEETFACDIQCLRVQHRPWQDPNQHGSFLVSLFPSSQSCGWSVLCSLLTPDLCFAPALCTPIPRMPHVLRFAYSSVTPLRGHLNPPSPGSADLPARAFRRPSTWRSLRASTANIPSSVPATLGGCPHFLLFTGGHTEARRSLT